jgi:hypothetical protein
MDTLKYDYLEKIKLQIHKAKQMSNSISNIIEPFSTKEKYLEFKNSKCFSFCDKNISEFGYDEESSSNSSENSSGNLENFLQE